MKLIALISALLLAACEKTSDVGAMQDEANGIVAAYKTRFDAAQARMRALLERSGNTKSARELPDFPDIGKLYGTAQTTLTEMQNQVRQAPTILAARAKGTLTAIPGVEKVETGAYRRFLKPDGSAKPPHERPEPPERLGTPEVRTVRSDLLSAIADYDLMFEAMHTELNRSLDLVESWLIYSELRPKTVAVVPPPPSPEPAPAPAP